MPEYSGLEINLVDGDTSTVISQDELEKTEIKMLPPPIARGSKRRLEVNSEDKAEIEALKAELEALKKAKRAETRARACVAAVRARVCVYVCV